MKIYPDYKHQHICHYCKKNQAEEEYQYDEEWYGVFKQRMIPMSIEYIKAKVAIPRCKECYKKHSKSELPSNILMLTSIIVGTYLLFFKDGKADWITTWYMWILAIFLILLTSGLIGMIIGVPIRYLINSVFYSDSSKDPGMTRDYPPIRKLVGCGFEFTRPDPAAGECKKVNEKKFNEAINSIITEDKCRYERW